MRRSPVHRFFYALKPPEDALDFIAAEQWRFRPGHEVQPPNFHITLAVTNDFEVYPDRVEREMKRIGNRIGAASCPIVLDRAVASKDSVALRPSRRLKAADQLHRMLRGEMCRSPVRLREDWGYSAHLTLLYRGGALFERPVLPISWRSTEFVLVHSVVGHGEHRILGRWPLRGPEPSTLH